MEQRKTDMINYILGGMRRYDFERADHRNKIMGFKNYDEFENFQRQHVNKSDEASITSLETLRNLIPTYSLMDKEYMGDWEADGFAFNKKGRIVIFHER